MFKENLVTKSELSRFEALSKETVSLFDGVGFDTNLAIKSLQSKYAYWRRIGLSPEQAIIRPLAENRGDIIGYKSEYMLEESWLANPLEYFIFEGQKRIRNKFSNFPLSSGIKAEERNGAVAEALSKVETQLLSAPSSSVMAVISPAGWSGLKDNQGREIVYPDAQIYLYQKDSQNKLNAFTLVLDDLSLEQYEQLARKWGVDTSNWNDLSEKDRLAAIVKNVVYLPSTKETFESMVKMVQKIKGSNQARTNKRTGEVKLFDEIYQKIFDSDRLLEMDQECSDYIDHYEKFVKDRVYQIENGQVSDELRLELEHTLLKVYRTVKGLPQNQYSGKLTAAQIKWVYQKEIRALRQIGGCAGGGGGLGGEWGIFNNGFIGRLFFAEGTKSKKCKLCSSQDAVEGGCGFCDSCAKKLS